VNLKGAKKEEQDGPEQGQYKNYDMTYWNIVGTANQNAAFCPPN
jgi:hypothetical protein